MSETKRIPRVIKEGKMKIQGIEIKVCVLDDGRRIIPEEDFDKALNLLGLSKEEFAKLMAGQKGGRNGLFDN